MPSSVHPACLSEKDLVAGCDFERTRRSGPGGQHRNKVESAIVVTHRDTGISGQASERRSQNENRTEATRRLRVSLAVNVRKARSGEPSDGWKERCPSQRINVSTKHDSFPCLLAEALDYVYQHELQVAAAADNLGCSTSQLIKFIKQETAAFTRLNNDRKARKMSPLK